MRDEEDEEGARAQRAPSSFSSSPHLEGRWAWEELDPLSVDAARRLSACSLSSSLAANWLPLSLSSREEEEEDLAMRAGKVGELFSPK